MAFFWQFSTFEYFSGTTSYGKYRAYRCFVVMICSGVFFHFHDKRLDAIHDLLQLFVIIWLSNTLIQKSVEQSALPIRQLVVFHLNAADLGFVECKLGFRGLTKFIYEAVLNFVGDLFKEIKNVIDRLKQIILINVASLAYLFGVCAAIQLICLTTWFTLEFRRDRASAMFAGQQASKDKILVRVFTRSLLAF